MCACRLLCLWVGANYVTVQPTLPTRALLGQLRACSPESELMRSAAGTCASGWLPDGD